MRPASFLRLIPRRALLHTSTRQQPIASARSRLGFALAASAVAGGTLLAWQTTTSSPYHRVFLEAAAEKTPRPQRAKTAPIIEPASPPTPPPSSSTPPPKPTSDTSSTEPTASTPPTTTTTDEPSPNPPSDHPPPDGDAGQVSNQSAYNPETGEINWDCPCLGGMADGPCGPQFREAFSCFIYSEKEPKGIECVEKFQGMQECFRQHPEIYGQEIDDEDELDAAVVTEEPSAPAPKETEFVADQPEPEPESASPPSPPPPAQASTPTPSGKKLSSPKKELSK